MKPSFSNPRITFKGSLRAVTAFVSAPADSDAQLKRDVEAYDPVLPRLKGLSPPTGAVEHHGRKQFHEPVVRHEGSLVAVTGFISGTGVSDASLKTDVEPYDPVLPRLAKLTS